MTGGIDSGLVMLDVLNYWRRIGMMNNKILAYVRINPSNHAHVKQAIYLFGGVYMGFQVSSKCVEEFNARKPWTPGNLIYSGHAVHVVGYDDAGVNVLTWGSTQRGMWSWWDNSVDEAYAILPPEAGEGVFAPGFDFERLKKDLSEVAIP